MPHRLGMEAVYFRCRNWRKFQHYPEGSRGLSWIKNWVELDDPGNPFNDLSFSDQGKLQAIWRLAAKLDNVIAYDEKFVCRAIRAKAVPFERLLADKWIQVGTLEELKKLTNAEKRAANRKKPASKPVAIRKQTPTSETESEKDLERTSFSSVQFVSSNGAGLNLEDEARKIEDRLARQAAVESPSARLLEALGDSSDEGTLAVLRSFLAPLPAYAVDVVLHELAYPPTEIRNRTHYAMGLLKKMGEPGNKQGRKLHSFGRILESEAAA
jgi:hypothetical protein